MSRSRRRSRRSLSLPRLDRRAAARAVLLVAFAGLWIAAAAYLWRSAVPAGLDLPALDESDYFSAAELDAARDYERVARLIAVGTIAAVLAVLAVYAHLGTRFLRESAAAASARGCSSPCWASAWPGSRCCPRVPRALVAATARPSRGPGTATGWWGAGSRSGRVPLRLSRDARRDGARGAAAQAVVDPRRRRLRRARLFSFIFPYLAGGERLRDPELVSDARAYAREQGISPVPIEVAEVSTETSAPNAWAGLGPSRRIVLWDTILDGRFDRGELDLVLAHELAHHSRHHLWESVGWFALFAFPGAWAIARLTRRCGGMRDPRAVPLALLLFVGLSTLALPAENAISRHAEQEADWVALETTEEPREARDAFERLSTALLSDPDPPDWTELLLDTHPSSLDRIAMVEALGQRHGR